MNDKYNEMKAVYSEAKHSHLIAFRSDGTISVNYCGGFDTIDKTFKVVKTLITLLEDLQAEKYVCTEMFYLNELKSFIMQWSS